MLHTGDYFNYRYGGEYDSFNTKPPLFTWIVAGSISVFGESLFALRLPSALAFIGLVTVLYVFLTERWGRSVALYTLAILGVVEGVVGQHVARSGDTDMLFVLFTTLLALAIFRWTEQFDRWAPARAVAWATLAFWTKGLALALIFPGLIAWLTWRKRSLPLSQLAMSVLLAVAAATLSWAALSKLGTEVTYPNGAANLWQAMFLTDGLERFTDPTFESGYQWDYLPVVLDIKFGPFIYLLYAAVPIALYRYGWRSVLNLLAANPLLCFCLVVSGSVAIVLLFSQNKHQWYIAPAIVFMSVVMGWLLSRWAERHRYVEAAVIIGLLGLYCKKVTSILANIV